MDEIKNFRSSTPVITRDAENAARVRLLEAMREPTPAPPSTRPAATGSRSPTQARWSALRSS